MQRLACTLIGGALAMITALVGLLISDAMSPGRLSPMLAFYGACVAGALLIGGLVLLERSSRREHWAQPISG
jgi:zinc transporter ZupT